MEDDRSGQLPSDVIEDRPQRIDRTYRTADQIALGHRSLPLPVTPNRQKPARFPMMLHFALHSMSPCLVMQKAP